MMAPEPHAGKASPAPGDTSRATLDPAGLRPPRELLRQMPAVIWAVDAELRFTLSDGGGLAALDIEPGSAVGLDLFEYFGTTDPDHIAIAAHRRALGGRSANYQLGWSGRTFHSSVEPLRDEDGRIVGAVGFAIDITERILLEEELRQAEARYRTLVEQLPAIVYVAGLGRRGGWLYVSPQLTRVLGYRVQEWIAEADPLARRLHPDDRERVLREEERCREQGLPFACEYRVQAADGRWVWVRDEAIPVAQAPELRQGLLFDITAHQRGVEARRKALEAVREGERRRRELLERLVSAQEEEQRRIAGDVHDGPVQMMVAAGLRLQMLAERLRDPRDRELLGEIGQTIRQGTRELRRLIFELVPPTLESEGLARAVEELLERLSEEDGIGASLQDRLGFEPPDPARRVGFRIVQEALRNVRKHARPRTVEVLLETSGHELHGLVRDDGRGFDTRDAGKPGHYGVSGMRERAQDAGGRLEMTSAPGEGTSLELWIPLPSGPPPEADRDAPGSDDRDA